MAETKIPDNWVKKDDGCYCPPDTPDSSPCQPTLRACPADPRYPNANQTIHCFRSFVDYQRCARLLGDYPGCKHFLRCYQELCPNAWVDKWYDQMERGIFPRKIFPPSPIIRPERSACLDVDEEEDPPSDKC